jgi:thiamine biosynthesis protein ThiS
VAREQRFGIKADSLSFSTILVLSEGGQTKILLQNLGDGGIAVRINGEEREVPAGLNLKELLLWLKIETDRVAVELNRLIVRKVEWETTRVEAGSEIEIVMFVGGGSR